jgi:hypothetical protein
MSNTMIYREYGLSLTGGIKADISGFPGGSLLIQLGAIHCRTSFFVNADDARLLAASLIAGADACDAERQVAA